MDANVRMFLWILGTGCFFAVLGAIFGAVTGVVTLRSGRAAGSFLGLSVARAFDRVGEKELSLTARGILIGGTDGFVFLGVLGLAAGTFVAFRHPQEWQFLFPIATGGALLVLGALAFGALAYTLRTTGVWGILGFFGGGVSGALLGAYLAGEDGLMAGILLGATLGTLVVVGRTRKDEDQAERGA